jgi:large subunit ribosomal protein L24
MPSHVRKGDSVMVTAGDHRGKVGEVQRVIPDKEMVIVKGINLRTKHLKPTRINPQGGVITKEAPIHISNVSPVVEGHATRVRFPIGDDGSKNRVAVRGGKVLGNVRGARAKKD